jgi:type I restriction enzyme M protein
MLTKQDLPTYNRLLKILKRLNSRKPFFTAYLCNEINEDEKDIRSDLAKLRKIRGFPLQNINDEYSFKDDFIGLLEDVSLELIASSIAIHKLNNNIDYTTTISNILKNLNYGVFALPVREDIKYKDIENFKAYELSYCIANEMAIRNKTIEKQIRKFYYLENLVPELSFTKLTKKIDNSYIANNLKNKYLISVYHCEINYFGELSSIEYSKDKQNDLFGYNEVPIDSLLKRRLHLNNNEKNELETYQKIDFKNIMSDRNPDGFKLSQEYNNDEEGYYSSIIPDFHRKLIDPNLVSVPLNFSLPKEELIAYISHIKDSLFPDEQKINKSKQILTVSELLNKERYKDHKKSRRYPAKVKASKIADYLYIYDYVTERIKQLGKPFLADKEKIYVNFYEKYKEIKKEFLNNINLKHLNIELSKQYSHIEKNINSNKIDAKDLIKNKYKELLQLYSTYYMEEIPHVAATTKIITSTLNDINTINEQKIELFYKISLTYFYIIEDYRHLLKEIRRFKKLPAYNNKKIKKQKKAYKQYYTTAKKSTHKIRKELKKLIEQLSPNKYRHIKKANLNCALLEEIHEKEQVNLANQKFTEEYEKDLDIYEDAIPEEDDYLQIENIHLESILREKHLLRQFKLNKTTILDYYYAIKPYIEDYKYKDLLSGVITPDELKPSEDQIKDARKLSKEEQQEIRYEVISLLKEGKLKVTDIAKKVGISKSRVYEWKRLYQKSKKDNSDFIKIKQRGRKQGNTFITIEQQKTIIQNLVDATPKDLLGVNKGNDEEKYLDISGISGLLNKKKILFASVKAWSEIDLKPFNNSEITTLEEHIKRKWADISAETAGEQYTPDDVIALISEIITSKTEDSDEFLTIYDPTCGGGNMLYGVEDRIKEKFPNRPTATRGQDWNDALYALAKIESRFRSNAKIEYGNTLTNDKFDEEFSVVVANPPYGVDWKGYKSDIEKDKTERFHALPAVSDGQLLFLQHIISKMSLKGMAVVVHNGSTLFSGDAGSGESEIRKWMFEQDIVEAIIQLPTDEFFNTNIYTYLWVLNKDKKHKNKVMMINASDKYMPLKKSKGKKRKEVDERSRLDIVKTLNDFKSNDYAQVFDKEYFYYNKQAIQLTNLDYQDKTVKTLLKGKAKSIKFDPIKVEQNDLVIDKFEIESFDKERYTSLKHYNDVSVKVSLKEFDYKEQDLKVHTDDGIYFYDEDKETIIKQVGKNQEELGCGKIVIKSSYKKETKTKAASIVITVELTPDYQKDYEIILFSRDEDENQKNIEDFMDKYVTNPFVYLENTVGVEINFNKIFYKPEKLRPLENILTDIDSLDNEIKNLERELGL